MKHILNHLIIPAMVPAIFLLVASTPVEVLGCRNRGLMAVLIAIMGALFGVGAAIKGAMGKARGNPNANWWLASTLILAIPAVYIIYIVN
jgi:uncharacterized membrane protein YjfL (UPF0719 family)